MIFTFNGKVTVSTQTQVEADSYEEALKIANGRQVATIGFGDSVEEVWLIEEADGAVFDVERG